MALRAVPIFRDAMFFISFEANMGWDRGSRWAKYFEKRKRDFGVVYMERHRTSTSEQPKYGTYTTPQSKKDGEELLRNSLLTGALCYAHPQQFVSSAPEKNRKQLHEQLRLWRREIKEASDPMFGTAKTSSGAKGPAGSGKYDDKAMCVMMNIGEHRRKIAQLEFVEAMRQRGWLLTQ